MVSSSKCFLLKWKTTSLQAYSIYDCVILISLVKWCVRWESNPQLEVLEASSAPRSLTHYSNYTATNLAVKFYLPILWSLTNYDKCCQQWLDVCSSKLEYLLILCLDLERYHIFVLPQSTCHRHH